MIINKNTIYNTKNYSGYNNKSGTQIKDSIENVFFLSDNEISKNDLIQPPFLHKIVISNVTSVLHLDEKIVFDINQQLSAMQDYIFDKTVRKATKDGNYFITIYSGTKIKYNIVEKPEDTLEGFYLSLLTNFYIESSDLTGGFPPDQYKIDFYITLKSSQSIYFNDNVHVNGNLAVDKCIGTLIKQDNNKQKIYDNIPVEYNHLYHIVATHKPSNGTFNHHYLYLHNTHDPGRSTCTANLFAITSNTSKQDANDGPSVCMILNDETTIKVKIHYAGSYSIDDAMSLDRFAYGTNDNYCTQCLTVYDLGIYLGVDRQLNP